MSIERIVLAYSGGLDVSVAIPWLAEKHQAEVVTVTLDLGRGELPGALEDIRDRALASGAVRAHVLDVREEFARDFIVPSLRADAVGEDRRPLTAALSRPLIARKLVEIAVLERAPAVAHGCGADDRDRVRIETAVRALAPDLEVFAPVRDWGMLASQEIEYASAKGIDVAAALESGRGADTNLWGRSGLRYTVTKAPEECPAEPAYVDLTFERGVPAAINGVSMPIVELIGSLGHIAGAHGVGRFGPLGSHPVMEAPAAVALHTALRHLRALASGSDVRRTVEAASREYADIVDGGLWFSPSREALERALDAAEPPVTGMVRLRLLKGECLVSPRLLKGSSAANPEPPSARLPVLKG